MASPQHRDIDEQAAQEALGRALTALRHQAGLTQEQLADRAGMDVTYVSQVERGRRGVRWYTVLRFARALDVSLVELGTEVERQTAGDS